MSSSRRILPLLLWSIAWTATAAEELESLDEDFLSYLAELENDEDDWTIVEPASAPTSTATVAKPASPSANSPPVMKQSPKTTTPPTKPATHDDGSKQ
jgi:hypothetical protein